MIVSDKPNRSNSRWLQVCVLLCAMVVLPVCIASAQDYEAVAKRLETAVKEGELTQEHADAMMTTLKRMGQRESGDDSNEYEAVVRRIRGAVASGKMTREEAGEKLEGYKKRMAIANRGGGGMAERLRVFGQSSSGQRFVEVRAALVARFDRNSDGRLDTKERERMRLDTKSQATEEYGRGREWWREEREQKREQERGREREQERERGNQSRPEPSREWVEKDEEWFDEKDEEWFDGKTRHILNQYDKNTDGALDNNEKMALIADVQANKYDEFDLFIVMRLAGFFDQRQLIWSTFDKDRDGKASQAELDAIRNFERQEAQAH